MTHPPFITGKERDAESGLDYFGARYYGSNMGRFMSPDWSDPAQPVPYANLERPQSLNLYSYVENNPLSQVDDDGHSTVIFDGQAGTITVRANGGTETTFPASNNPQMSLTIGKLVDGNYAFLDTQRPHHHSPEEDSHDGAYGSGGIFRLKPFKGKDGKEHDGVGLHAGRADSTDRAGRSGCNYATNGCVRTTEKAIQFIMNLAPNDPLTDLQVQHNRHGDDPSPKPPGPPKPPKLIPRPHDDNDGVAMLNNLAKLTAIKCKGKRSLHLCHGLLAVALTQCAWGTVLAQQTHVVLNDHKVLVTQINLSPGESYSVPKDDSGAVWTVLDPALIATKKDGSPSSKPIRPGDAAVVGVDEELVFQGQTGQPVRVVFVKPKGPHQELTVGRFLASGSLEDASDRNATLLVATSASCFRDTRNLGDESEWVPGKPIIVAMKAGTVRWIRPGIHHFKNLGSTAAKLVSVEW